MLRPSSRGSVTLASSNPFDAPIIHAEFHPRNWKIVLASLSCNEIDLVDLRDNSRVILEDTMDGEIEVDGSEEAKR